MLKYTKLLEQVKLFGDINNIYQPYPSPVSRDYASPIPKAWFALQCEFTQFRVTPDLGAEREILTLMLIKGKGRKAGKAYFLYCQVF